MKEEALCGNISSAFSPFSPHGAPAVGDHQCARNLLELQRGLDLPAGEAGNGLPEPSLESGKSAPSQHWPLDCIWQSLKLS